MTKNLPIIIIFLFFFSSCAKDDSDTGNTDQMVPLQQQWGFALNYTATWCGPCGEWGAPRIHELYNVGDVIAITAHSSGDPMHLPGLYSSFKAERPVGEGIPSFYIGDIKSSSKTDMYALKEQIPKAGIAMSHSMDGLTITINTRTEFFSTRQGIFYLAVLILEDGIDGSPASGNYKQNGVADPSTYKHDFVLRAAVLQGTVYGEEIMVDPSKGDIVDKQYSIGLSPGWTNEVYPVAILWEKNSLGNPAFEFVNAVK